MIVLGSKSRIAAHGGSGMTGSSRTARGLIVLALLCLVGLAALYGRAVWTDSGWFVVVLFGIPLACAAIALAAECGSRTTPAPAVIAALAAVSLAWSMLTAGGIGYGFAVPSLLLLGAAVVSWMRRLRPGPDRSGIEKHRSSSHS